MMMVIRFLQEVDLAGNIAPEGANTCATRCIKAGLGDTLCASLKSDPDTTATKATRSDPFANAYTHLSFDSAALFRPSHD